MDLKTVNLPRIDLALSPFFFRELNGYGTLEKLTDGNKIDASNNLNHILNYNGTDYTGTYRVELASSVPTYFDSDGVERIKVDEAFDTTDDTFTSVEEITAGEKVHNRGKLSTNVTLYDLDYDDVNKDAKVHLYSESGEGYFTIKSEEWKKNITLSDDDLYVKGFFLIDDDTDFVLFYGLFSDEDMEANPVSGSLIFDLGLIEEYSCSMFCTVSGGVDL